MTNITLCSIQLYDGAITKPDPDISGIGVIIAFVFSACITLAATLSAYALGLVDEGLLHPVDRLVLRAPSRAARHVGIHVALRKAILALSDQQIVTGIAILAAGFNGLRLGNITVYHFQIVIYLAWMSSSVHLSALTLLRPFMHYHKGVMVWRVVGMLVLFIMLVVALVVTVSNEWAVITTRFTPSGEAIINPPLSTFGVPASCFWGRLWGEGVNPDSILSFVVLFVSYVWKMGGMFSPVRRAFARRLRNPVDRLLEKMLSGPARRYERTGGQPWLWTFRIALAVYLPLEASLEVLGSFSAALWLSVLGLIYGIMQILIPRQFMMAIDPSLAEAESNLGFGQLIPLILLVQPLGAVTEHIWAEKEDEALYTDHGGADPYSATLGHYQEGRHLIGIPESPLLQYMASYELPPWSEQAPQRIQLKALLYTSKLFHLMVFITQGAVAATAGVVFWADYTTIGVVPASNWYFISFGAAAWAGLCPFVTLCLAPVSRLGKYYKRDRRISVASEGQTRPDDLKLQPVGGSSQGTEGEEKATLSPTRVELGPTRTGEVTEVWSSEWRRASVQHPPRSPVSAPPKSPVSPS